MSTRIIFNLRYRAEPNPQQLGGQRTKMKVRASGLALALLKFVVTTQIYVSRPKLVDWDVADHIYEILMLACFDEDTQFVNSGSNRQIALHNYHARHW